MHKTLPHILRVALICKFYQKNCDIVRPESLFAKCIEYDCRDCLSNGRQLKMWRNSASEKKATEGESNLPQVWLQTALEFRPHYETNETQPYIARCAHRKIERVWESYCTPKKSCTQSSWNWCWNTRAGVVLHGLMLKHCGRRIASTVVIQNALTVQNGSSKIWDFDKHEQVRSIM